MTTNEFAKAMKAPLWVAQALERRGIATLDDARLFFKPQPETVHNAETLEGLSVIVDALIELRNSGKKLAIHGDYDVDGLTGAALLYQGLWECGFRNMIVHIPNRYSEGYGVTIPTIDSFAAEGVQTILTVDTGISAVEEVAYANSLGMEVYLTDHHKQGDELPPAAAIANPNLRASQYPNKQLSGVGVAYKLLELLVKRLGSMVDPKEYLDLFALGTLADVVGVTGENRYYLVEGLKRLSRTKRPGLRVLLDSVGMTGVQLRSQDLLFRVTPLINAGGRMGAPRDAYELLVADDLATASKLLRKLRSANDRRRLVESETAQKAIEWIDSHPQFADDPLLFVVGEGWPEEVAGVVGIIAARLVDHYKKPVAVAFDDHRNGVLCASARGLPGFDWHNTLSSVSDLLTRWGGHSQAAGFSLEHQHVEEFRRRVVERTKQLQCSQGEVELPQRESYPLNFDDVNQQMMVWLQRFEPFGQGNDLPTFVANNVELGGECRVVGQTHLKMRLKQKGHTFDAIAFGRGSLCDCLQNNNQPIQLLFQPEINRFRDKETLQLLVTQISLPNSEKGN